MLRINILPLLLRCKRHIENIFKDIVDNGLKCYIWGVNTKINMKRVIKMRYNDEIVEAIYTDYPDILLSLITEQFK